MKNLSLTILIVLLLSFLLNAETHINWGAALHTSEYSTPLLLGAEIDLFHKKSDDFHNLNFFISLGKNDRGYFAKGLFKNTFNISEHLSIGFGIGPHFSGESWGFTQNHRDYRYKSRTIYISIKEYLVYNFKKSDRWTYKLGIEQNLGLFNYVSLSGSYYISSYNEMYNYTPSDFSFGYIYTLENGIFYSIPKRNKEKRLRFLTGIKVDLQISKMESTASIFEVEPYFTPIFSYVFGMRWLNKKD